MADHQRRNPSNLDALFVEIWPELRRLAKVVYRQDSGGLTWQPTDLASEVAIRILRRAQQGKSIEEQQMFFLQATYDVWRHYLQRRHREKRDARRRVRLQDAGDVVQTPDEDKSGVLSALVKLAEDEPRLAAISNLKLFGNMSFPEIARELNISESTACRDWKRAKTYLIIRVRDFGGD